MDQNPPAPSAAPRPCPHCGKPAVARHRPFCSAHCANIDLGHWLNGDYRVAANDPDDDSVEDLERD